MPIVDPDADLKLELKSWRELHRMHVGTKVPKTVSAQSGKMVAFLEELLTWRDNGRKWLKRLKQEEKSNARKVLPSEESDDSLFGRS